MFRWKDNPADVWAALSALEAQVEQHESVLERIEQTLQELQEQLYHLRD